MAWLGCRRLLRQPRHRGGCAKAANIVDRLPALRGRQFVLEAGIGFLPLVICQKSSPSVRSLHLSDVGEIARLDGKLGGFLAFAVAILAVALHAMVAVNLRLPAFRFSSVGGNGIRHLLRSLLRSPVADAVRTKRSPPARESRTRQQYRNVRDFFVGSAGGHYPASMSSAWQNFRTGLQDFPVAMANSSQNSW